MPFVLRAPLSGLIVASVAKVARRSPGLGGLIASLPILSVLGVVWLWRDTGDTGLMVDHLPATFWFGLPSLAMFLLIPALLRRGWAFPRAMTAGCALSAAVSGLTRSRVARAGVAI